MNNQNEPVNITISAKEIGLAIALEDGKFILTKNGSRLYTQKEFENNQNERTNPEVKTVDARDFILEYNILTLDGDVDINSYSEIIKAIKDYATIHSSSKDAALKELTNWNEFLKTETEKDAIEIVELRKELKVAVEALEALKGLAGKNVPLVHQIIDHALKQIKNV